MKFEIRIAELSLQQDLIEFQQAMRHTEETKTDAYVMEDFAIIPTLPPSLFHKGREIEKERGVTFLHFYVSGFHGLRHGKNHIYISGIIEQ